MVMSEVVAAGMMMMGVLEPLARKKERQFKRTGKELWGIVRYLSFDWAAVWLVKLQVKNKC